MPHLFGRASCCVAAFLIDTYNGCDLVLMILARSKQVLYLLHQIRCYFANHIDF